MRGQVHGRRLGALRLTSVLVAALFILSTVPGIRPEPGFDTLLDGWLQGGSYVLLAGVAWLRPLLSTQDRLLWGAVAAAMSLRALGFVLYLAVVRRQDPLPVPSIADVAWLLVPVALLVALCAIARAHSQRVSVMLLLDAVLGALAAAAVVIALLYGVLMDLTAPGTPAWSVAIHLAYPMLDMVLVIFVVGALTMADGRPTLSVTTLSIGIVAIAAVDMLYLYQVSAGTFRPATFIAALSMVGTLVVVAAGWVPGEASRRSERGREPPATVVPAVFALVCLAALAAATMNTVPVWSVITAVVGLVLAMGRGLLTIFLDRREAGRRLRAKHESLQRFRSLVETSNDFIAIALTDGSVRYVNPAGRRLVGLPEDADVTATTIADYLTEDGLRHSLDFEQPAVLAHGRWEGESTLRDMRGGAPTPVAIASYVMPHPETGEPWALATVQRDITERIAGQHALQALADQRQILLGRLMQAQEDERSRIASDVHDDSVQALAAVDLRLGHLRRLMQEQAPRLLADVDELRVTLEGATARLRHLLFDLESPARRADLLPALEEAAAFVCDGDLEWTVRGDLTPDLTEATRVTVYRIAKEAMVNVRKHADATRVTVEVRLVDDLLEVTVADDGRGLAPDSLVARPGHLGVPGMRDRAVVAGGTLSLETAPTGGAVLRVRLPVGRTP